MKLLSSFNTTYLHISESRSKYAYQETKQGEYETKLTDGDYKDAPGHKAEDHYGDAYNMSMLKALMDEDKGPKEDRQAKPVGGVSKEDMKGMQSDPEGGKSPLNKGHDGPLTGNPDPIGVK